MAIGKGRAYRAAAGLDQAYICEGLGDFGREQLGIPARSEVAEHPAAAAQQDGARSSLEGAGPLHVPKSLSQRTLLSLQQLVQAGTLGLTRCAMSGESQLL